jgi:hypothetical protein
VHIEQVNYTPATADMSVASLTGPLNDITQGNGVFSGIAALRKQYGADLVHLIVYPTTTVSSCGGGKGWLANPLSPDYGYSVTYDHGNSAISCNLNDLAVAHELGHNMGLDHDRAHASYIDAGYAYGYAIIGKFADIMSFGYVNAPVLAKFSTPNLICGPDSVPCGIAPGQPNAADAAQTLNDNREAVAAFLPAADAPPSAVACLFEWAESHYQPLFPTAARVPGVLAPYNYRYYPGAKAYLGVSTADNHVYYLGPDGKMLDEGTLASWLPVAGCQ